MSSALERFLAFLEEQKSRQAPHFPTVKYDKILSFMGTTSLPGSWASVSVNRVQRIAPAGSAREVQVDLAGPIVRRPTRGECVTVHLTRVEQYQGYQVKTKALQAQTPETDLLEETAGSLAVKGHHVYTVHHSPYTLKFFESVPFDELVETVGSVRYAVVGVGETANISPRFVFHHEVRGGKAALYHGDGLALKTYMNLKSNRNETRVVLDLDTFHGWALRGVVEEFQPHQHPEAYEKICGGFSSGNWGRPSRVFRFTAEELTPLSPVG